MSRGRGRGRGKGTAVTASSGLRIETASAIDEDELRVEDEDTDNFADSTGQFDTPDYSRYGGSTEADDLIISGNVSVTSNGNHDFRFHSNSFEVPRKTPAGKSTSVPPNTAIRFTSGGSLTSTPSPMFGVFQSRPGPASLPAISGDSPTESNPPNELEENGKPRQRVRGKTYKTPTYVSLNEDDSSRATKEDEFIEAQNGNLGKRKRTRTAIAYEAPKRKPRGRRGDTGAAGGSVDSREGSQEADIEMSEEDSDDDDDGDAMSAYGGTGA